MTINPASKTLYGVLAVLAFLLVGYFYIQESSSIREQLEQSLSERAEEASLRMSKSISLTAWEVYQQSTDRKFPEQLAAEILDSELETDFVLAIVVLGNFGHILMGREKTATGDIKSITKPSDISVDYANKVRTPMTQGTMTIGHIEIYFTDKFHIGNIKRATLASALRFLLYSFFFQISLFLLHRVNVNRLTVQKALTELQGTQNKLIESEKLASLGSLVAGIAHELNTPLGIAVTSFSLVEQETKKIHTGYVTNSLTKTQLGDYLELTLQTIKLSNQGLSRAIELINHFKQISSDQYVEDTREINLRAYIEEVMITLAIGLKRSGVEFVITGDHDLNIESIPGAIAQVITNLVNNAKLHAFEEASPNKEVSGTPTRKLINIHLANVDQHKVLITFSDNGKGMSAETVNKIYEPFFTTKRGRGGTGLGMNIVFNIVSKKLKGHISVTSNLGVGTTFEITLPHCLKSA